MASRGSVTQVAGSREHVWASTGRATEVVFFTGYERCHPCEMPGSNDFRPWCAQNAGFQPSLE